MTLAATRAAERAFVANSFPAAPDGVRQMLYTLADVHAAARYALEQRIAQTKADLHLHTAITESAILARAASFGCVRKTATAASGTILVTGAASSILPAGAELSDSGGNHYITSADCILGTNGTGVAAITCTVAGAAGNQSAGTQLTITQPVAGIAPKATIISCSGGADAESIEALRARALSGINLSSAVGTTGQYQAWALAATPNIVWASALANGDGLGTMFIYVLGAAQAAPSAADIATATASIAAKAFPGARFLVLAPTLTPVPLGIHLANDSAAQRAAVSAALAAFFVSAQTLAAAVAPISLLSVIQSATGAADTLLAPASVVQCAANAVPVLGTIAWV